MKNNRDGKTKLSTKIFSGIFFLVCLSVLILIAVAFGKDAYRKKQVQNEIESLHEQANRLEQENGDMENLLSYISSREFQEKEAREKLNLQKENEKMIVLRKDAASPQSTVNQPETVSENRDDSTGQNWKKWWDFFFAPKNII